MGADATPRTKLDFIYQDVLREVAEIVGRLEVVAATVEQAARTCAADRAADVLERTAAASSNRVRADLERAASEARESLAGVVKDLVRHGEAATAVARWEALAITTGLSILASFVGGSLVILLHAVGWW